MSGNNFNNNINNNFNNDPSGNNFNNDLNINNISNFNNRHITKWYQRFVLDGVFNNNKYIEGSIYVEERRLNKKNILCEGLFYEINIKEVFNISLKMFTYSNIKNILIKKLVYGNLYDNIIKSKFTGSLINGYPEKGVFYRSNCKIYEGSFNINSSEPIGTIHRWNGNGIEYNLNGTKKYEGSFSNGLYHGNGTLYSVTNTIEYIGMFMNGMKHGQGMLFDTDQHIILEGTFYQNNFSDY